jgi:hypothetical protein
MKQRLPIGMLLLVSLSVFSNVETDSILVKKWTQKKTLGLILTQTAFVNWNAGGENSIAGIASINLEFNYKKDRISWNNTIRGRYGLNKEESEQVRKTEDVFEITSNFSIQQDEKSQWHNSARFNFRTQFASGYKYPDRALSISTFFAPAYLFLGAGTQFTSSEKKYKLYLSPLTNKITLVLNQRLANNGAFGVEKAVYKDGLLVEEGANSKIEFGTLLSGEWRHEIMENILMNNKLILYSDYLNKYGNIDFDWELTFDLKVNKHINANIGTHLLYDDDVKEKDSERPKIQLKQLLGVGLTYAF